MKKNIPLLIRFLVLASLFAVLYYYCREDSVFKFWFLIVCCAGYGVCFFLPEHKSDLIKVITDSAAFFLCFVGTIICVCLMFCYSEGVYMWFYILQLMLLIIFFLFCLRKDILVYPKIAYKIRLPISMFFTAVFSFLVLELLFTLIKESSVIIFLSNLSFILPPLFLFLFWLIQDIRKIKGIKNL